MSTSFAGPLLESVGLSGSRDYKRDKPIWADTDYVVEMNDFTDELDISTSDWTNTAVGVGTASILAGSVNGVFSLVNAAADNDSLSFQKLNEVYKLVSGKKLWFETLLQTDSITESDYFVGLCITDTTPLDATDFVGFRVADGAADILCKTTKNSTETSTDSGVNIVASTNVRLGFLVDGVGKVEFYVNRNKVATHTTNICDDEELCITIHHQNGSAAARTMLIDYIQVVKQR